MAGIGHTKVHVDNSTVTILLANLNWQIGRSQPALAALVSKPNAAETCRGNRFGGSNVVAKVNPTPLLPAHPGTVCSMQGMLGTLSLKAGTQTYADVM